MCSVTLPQWLPGDLFRLRCSRCSLSRHSISRWSNGRSGGRGKRQRRWGPPRRYGQGMSGRVWQGAAVATIAVALLTQCAVGPDFAPPSAPDVTRYTPEPLGNSTASAATAGGGAQRFAGDLDLPG